MRTIKNSKVVNVGEHSNFKKNIEGLLYDSIMLALLRDCTRESMNPRSCFQALQFPLCFVLLLATLLFLYFSDYKDPYLLFILHLYDCNIPKF